MNLHEMDEDPDFHDEDFKPKKQKKKEKNYRALEDFDEEEDTDLRMLYDDWKFNN